MLYPIENQARGIYSLDGIWKFRLDDGTGMEQHWEASPLQHAYLLSVPGSYNDQKDEPEFRNHCGWAFYQRTLQIPSYLEGQRLVLRMDAVTHDARVWLDGKQIAEHKGGFLPFEVELTERMRPGTSALLTIAVDNRVSHSTLPVGNEGATAFFGSDNPDVPSVIAAKKQRREQNLPNFDFFNYAGINRHVRVYTTPVSYIEDVTVVTGTEQEDGIVSYEVAVAGAPSGAVPEVQLLDAEGREVAGQTGAKGEMRVPKAQLWWPWPGTPYLYTLQIRYGEDCYEQQVGIRTVRTEGQKFLINGQPFYFKGFGKHEDSFAHGRGTDDCINVKDIGLLHWIHANSFRTSHYPYAEEMYALCDREGIVIIDETPAVGIGAGALQNPYETFPIRDYHRQVLHDLIARDKNHPCVVMWSLGNEPDTVNFPESAREYWQSLYAQAHEEDPSDRPVTFVCCQNNYEKDQATRTMDVVCINRYYGWYNLSGDLDAACYAWNKELDFWETQNKPVMLTEYGADAVEGIHMTNGEMFSEEFQMEYLKKIDMECDKRPFFIGEQVWNFADFNTIQGCMRVNGNRKGVFTRDRRPKMAAHFLRDRWKQIPDFGYKSGMLPQQELQADADTICMEICSAAGEVRACTRAQGGQQAVLACRNLMAMPGDRVRIHVPSAPGYYVISLDPALGEALVYLTGKEWQYILPYGEDRKAYPPAVFSSGAWYLYCRPAQKQEYEARRNLAGNILDQHGQENSYPHASANIETRNEAVFAARNAIDGFRAADYHGEWPYTSWGINRNPRAEWKLEFGRPVDLTDIRFFLRADFPHDSWWKNVSVTLSDGSVRQFSLQKTGQEQTFAMEAKKITWLRLHNLQKAEDASPFPALTQLEVFGTPSV